MGVCNSLQSVKVSQPTAGAAENKKEKDKDSKGKHQNGERRHHHHHHHRRRKSLESNDSGLQMKPASDSDAIQHELLKLTKEEIAMLFQSFDYLVKNREDIANDIYKKLKEKVPDSVPKLPKRGKAEENWIGNPTALILLSGIERCLLRTNDTKRLEEFIRQMITKHQQKYGVPKEMLMASMDMAAAVVMKHVGLSHTDKTIEVDETSPKHIWQNCTSCTTWARFLEKLHKAFDAVSPDDPIPAEGPSSDMVCPVTNADAVPPAECPMHNHTKPSE